jgi:hypothetical protein
MAFAHSFPIDGAKPQDDDVSINTAALSLLKSPSRPSHTLRQANRSWLEIPCRRAVADASREAEKLSSTIRSFSAADHRRRALWAAFVDSGV